ncbi:MAG TPA: aminotransferase class V-fold PLP-dependent enzyme [Tepidisphaeraceae bacterium]|nr:aminotransferase class V-fold PLP-dependent enzyme [Tepidisphaeraceae bacterium]
MEIVYLDNNATTRLAPEVVRLMLPYLTENYGNPSSIHRLGQQARQAIDEARSKVAALLGCADTDVAFMGGGTEAGNTAIRGLLAARAPRKQIITSTVEHSATRELCQQLGKEQFDIVAVSVDQQGHLDLDQFQSALNEQTALVSIMWANNETGVIFPIEKIAELCRSKKVPLHCDATQVVGKIGISFRDGLIDVLTCAPHKFHGPKGIGIMAVKRGVRFRPMVIGGPQERNRRGGTENVAGIVGTGAAAELAVAHLPEMSRVAAQRDRLEMQILDRIDQTFVNGDPSTRVPNTTNIGFARLEAEAILLLLSEQGICASAGAACASGSLEPSPILQAMHIDPKIAHGAIRFSLSRYTTDTEIDRALQLLPPVISRLRQVLPV